MTAAVNGMSIENKPSQGPFRLPMTAASPQRSLVKLISFVFRHSFLLFLQLISHIISHIQQ